MMRFVLGFALALSLLFNVFFAVGYMRAQAAVRLANGESNGVTRDVARELELDDDQRVVFRELRTRLRQETAIFDDGIASARAELAAEMQQPEPDPIRLDSISHRIAELHGQRDAVKLHTFREFADVLSPEQRQRIMRHMHRRPGGGPDGRRPHGKEKMLRRFDANGDGVLDEDEKAKAREAIRQRHLRRQKMLERFDVNGDGRLDEDERSKMPEEFRRRRGGRRGFGPPPPPPPGS